MKTHFTILLILLCSVLYGQTTLEEYNYLTKGYKIQVESGLDMKKGYRLEDLMESVVSGTQSDILGLSTKNTVRRMNFKALYRDNEDKPCATLVIYTREDTGFQDYLCIPHFNSSLDIWNFYFEEIQKYDKDAAQALAWGLARVGAYFAAGVKGDASSEKKQAEADALNRELDGMFDGGPEKLEGISLGSGSVGGGLGSRGVVSAKKLIQEPGKQGVVTIKVCVDRYGNVDSASFTELGSTISDYTIVQACVENAKEWKFIESSLDKQCGTITYRFRNR